MCLPQVNRSFKLNKEYVLELLKLNDKKRVHDELVDWVMPPFPLNGNILMDNQCTGGKKIKYVLSETRDVWANSSFTLELDDLLKQVPELVQKFDDAEKQSGQRKKAKLQK